MATNKNNKVFKVFISSTYVDLKEYCQAAIQAVETFDELKPVAMEYFGSQPKEPSQVCDKEIKESDFFVGIYAYRYGHIPKGKKKSITQAEYELAKRLKKPCPWYILGHCLRLSKS